MMTLNEIREALYDRRLIKVAEATGIHYNTLREIRDRPDANPTYTVYAKLDGYLANTKQELA